MSLRDIKNTPDLVAVILPPVLDIGIRDTDLQAGLLPVYAASQPPPTLQAVDVGDVRVLRHRQHDIGGAVLRVDRLRIQIVQVGVRLTGDAHHGIVGKLAQLLPLRRFLRLPVLVPLLLLPDQIV